MTIVFLYLHSFPDKIFIEIEVYFEVLPLILNPERSKFWQNRLHTCWWIKVKNGHEGQVVKLQVNIEEFFLQTYGLDLGVMAGHIPSYAYRNSTHQNTFIFTVLDSKYMYHLKDFVDVWAVGHRLNSFLSHTLRPINKVL